ncbi:MAG: SprT-like domain-containing protein [Pseudomonadota bacterium]
MVQLKPQLPIIHDEPFLRNFLQSKADKPVSLVMTDNATSMISVRMHPDVVKIRLHRIFLGAGPEVLEEIAGFISKRKKGTTPHITAFIISCSSLLPRPKPRKVRLMPRGKHFNLAEMFDTLNRQYFDNRLSAPITWGKAASGYAVRKRTLGSYQKNSHIIRIHPLLDSSSVPRYYVEYVVYHEMLHAAMPCEARRVHSREFRQREKLFKQYDRAAAWEKRRWER